MPFDRGRDTEQFVFTHALGGSQVHHLGFSDRQSPCLVERDGRDRPEIFEMGTAFDKHSMSGGLGDACKDRRG